MKILFLFFAAVSLRAQTTAYLRMGGPPPVTISGSVHGNPPTIATKTGHGLAVNDIVGVWGMCSGANFDPASAKTPLNGLHKVLAVPTTTTFTISDGPASSTPVNDPGDSNLCGFDEANSVGGTPWAAKYTSVTLPAGPLGWFDGLTGTVTRKLSLRTTNGLDPTNGVVVSGCPGACVVTIATTYSHGLAVGDKFSINGTTSAALNTANTAVPQTAYTVASTTGTTFVTSSVTGLTNGNFTVNNTCGPNSPPDDTNTGTNPCVSISQLAYLGSPLGFWERLVSDANALYGPSNPNGYKFPQDDPVNGYYLNGPAYSVSNQYSLAAIRWFVNPADTTSFNAAIYFMKNVEKSFGVSWPCYSDPVTQACGVTGGGLQGDQDEVWAGFAMVAAIMVPAMAPASRQTFIDKIYNTTTDLTGPTVTTAHTDMSLDKLNKIVSTGHAQAGSSTSITLASSDAHATGFYVNNVVHVFYQSAITSIVVTAGTTITTAGKWGNGANIPVWPNPVAIMISGVTGAGCSAINNWHQPIAYISDTSFMIQNLPGCTAPSGGMITSYDVQCPQTVEGNQYNLSPCSGVITGYDATTKIAAIAGGFSGGTPGFTPTPDMSYKIFETMSVSSTAAKASAAVTGYNTHFTTDLAVGDTVLGANGFANTAGYAWQRASYVTAITDDTHLTALNESSVSAGTIGGLLAGAYTSGGSISGSSGQYCFITLAGGAVASATLTGANVIAGGSSLGITSPGSGYSLGSTTGTLTNGSATCSGTAAVAVTKVSAPSMLWIIPAWKPGDTGFKWYGDHWQGGIGSQSVAFPVSGGTGSACPGGPCPASNNGILYSHSKTAMALNLAPYDSRVVQDLAMDWSYALDFEFAHYTNYITGQAHSGSVYSLGNEYGIGFMAATLFPPIPGFPAADTTWAKGTALYNLYSILPDLNWNTLPRKPTPMGYGGESGQGYLDSGSPAEQAMGLNPAFSLAPASNEARYLGYFANADNLNWGNVAGRLNYDAIALLHNDPRTFTGALPYSGLPLQHAFLNSSPSACNAAVGSAGNNGNQVCPGAMKAFSMISLTGWHDLIGLTGRTNTLTYFGARTFVGDHDSPQCGATWIYKVGQLIGMDGTATLQYGNEDSTIHQDLLRFNNSRLTTNGGYSSTNVNGEIPYAYCSMTQWASSNHGSWDAQYGDQNSKYAYGCADIRGTYAPGTMNWGRRCVADLKDMSLNGGTGEQIVVQGTFVDTSTTPTAVEAHIHYSQNGQLFDPGQGTGMTYNEGNTTCPGSAGCRTLDSTRVLQSLEDGSGPVTSSLVSLTAGGYPTAIVTATASGAVLNQSGQISGVSGTGVCNGIGPVLSIADATHFVLGIDTGSCSSPSGGTFLSDFNPARTYGVLSKIFSPGTIDVRDDSATVAVTAVTPGNPTIFTAPANGIKAAAPLASIVSGGPAPFTGQTSFSYVTLSSPLGGIPLGDTAIKIFGVTSTGGPCASLNNVGLTVNTVFDLTHIEIVFNSSACSGVSGGVVIVQPEANVKILGATGQWAALNSNINKNGVPNCPACMGGIRSGTSVLAMTYIDPDNFSVPVDSTGFDPAAWNGTVYAAFPNSYGDSHRISLCGGSLCGAPVSSYETVVVHKIAQNLSDTTIAAVPLTVDSNWVGVQTKDKVILMSRGQFPQPAIAGFSTTHAGAAQYLFGNVAAGSWDIKINGTEVPGSPFNVQNGDNSIHFESTAGSVVASPTLQSCHATDSSPLPGATVGTAYSYTVHPSGCTAPLTWSLWSGSTPLCGGLSIDTSTGVISGIPDSAEVCTFTVQVQDATAPTPATATESLQITVTNSPVLAVTPSSLVFSCVAGGSNPAGQNVSIGATGVTLNNWTATKSQSWLSLSPGGAAAAGTMTVTASCTGKAAGSYSDTISIASSTSGIGNSPQTIGVSLVVSAAAAVPVGVVNGNGSLKGSVVIHE